MYPPISSFFYLSVPPYSLDSQAMPTVLDRLLFPQLPMLNWVVFCDNSDGFY